MTSGTGAGRAQRPNTKGSASKVTTMTANRRRADQKADLVGLRVQVVAPEMSM